MGYESRKENYVIIFKQRINSGSNNTLNNTKLNSGDYDSGFYNNIDCHKTISGLKDIIYKIDSKIKDNGFLMTQDTLDKKPERLFNYD